MCSIADKVNRSDLFPLKPEDEDDAWSTPRRPNEPGSAVHERELSSVCPASECFCHGRSPAKFVRSTGTDGHAIRTQDCVGVQHCEEGLEVTAAGGSQKRVDYPLVVWYLSVGDCRSLYSSSRPARQLPSREFHSAYD